MLNKLKKITSLIIGIVTTEAGWMRSSILNGTNQTEMHWSEDLTQPEEMWGFVVGKHQAQVFRFSPVFLVILIHTCCSNPQR